ncbi:MAG: mechanosensitive ion channel family protein [Oscillospiraceae bacterium]
MDFFNSLADIKLGDISLSSILSAVLIYVVCYAAIRLLCRAFEKLLDRSKHIDASLKTFFSGAIKAALWVIAIIIIAGSLGIPVTSLVAVLSVAGVALSLALQGLLSNLFSGITILATRPFNVGDYVQVGGEGGTVKSIGLFYTVLDTPDNRVIYAPNGDITSGKIVNYSAEPVRRVIIPVTASYDSATEDVRRAVLAAAAKDERILTEPAPMAAISGFGSSSVEYTVRVWCKSDDYWDVLFALNENIRDSFAEYGVEMSYDHLNVHIEKDTSAQ